MSNYDPYAPFFWLNEMTYANSDIVSVFDICRG
jgi:hypothetical protein